LSWWERAEILQAKVADLQQAIHAKSTSDRNSLSPFKFCICY
jgi:hypothetical protein